ncbi:hypothetical protein FIBSPDRAFT_906230, partial [Athelia psychrophila]
LISIGEMKIYVGMSDPNFRDRYFQHLVLGWMKFVAPLTPSKLEDVPRLKCVQDATGPFERIPEPIWFLLGITSEIARQAQGQLSGSVFPPFSKAWPTIWIWMRHIYRAHQDRADRLRQTMDAAQKDQLAGRYAVFTSILRSFTEHANQPVILKILSDYPEIFGMMADMWIEEAKDEIMVHGFQAGVFTAAVVPSGPSEQRFVAQIILACGGAEEAVNLACQRIEHNTKEAKEDYNAHIVDLHFFTASMSNAKCPIAPAMLASSRVARTLMCAWAHATTKLFLAPVKIRDACLAICMSSISVLVERSPRAYEMLRDVLHHNFIPLCLHSIPLVRSGCGEPEKIIGEAHGVLLGILPPATVHREILSIMQRSMTSPMLKDLPKDQHDVLTKPYHNLWHTIQHRRNAYKEHRQDRSRCVLLCGNAK